MKKILVMLIGLFLVTGCNANVDISIDKDTVTEKVTVSAANEKEYNQVKNWNGFPVTLYYDEELETPPWMTNREKENGVSYYDTNFEDIDYKFIGTGKFSMEEHTRSSLVRNCFKLYNIIDTDSKKIFSTSKGLICAFKNFDINISTPYVVTTNNASKVDKENNTYTWTINDSNYKDTNIYLEIDFSKKYNETDNDDNKDSKEAQNSNKVRKIITIVIVSGTVIVAFGGLYLYMKKQKASEL